MQPAARAVPPLRVGPLVWLTLMVLAVHTGFVAWLAEHAAQLGDGHSQTLRRMDVSFVRDLQASEPPVLVAEARPPAAAARVVQPPAQAASAAEGQGSAGATVNVQAPLEDRVAEVAPPEPLPPVSETTSAKPEEASLIQADSAAPQAQSASAAAGTVAVAGASASTASTTASGNPASATAVPFEWPPSTRLSYTLLGDYRGPVHGQARVEWLRKGDSYQVHLEVTVAAVLNRRMSSEGRLTEAGLQPLRYEEVTSALLRETRRQSLRFEADRIILANGQTEPTIPQVQDTASQFVQLTWLFTTQSHRLRVGESIEIPLALPRRVDRWVYDVHAEEEVDTPVGRIRAFHMKPRRLGASTGELLVESWFAPSLQYLPVRIIIRQGLEAYADLTLSRLPQQAADVAPAR